MNSLTGSISNWSIKNPISILENPNDMILTMPYAM
jgi:hypothetical protein